MPIKSTENALSRSIKEINNIEINYDELKHAPLNLLNHKVRHLKKNFTSYIVPGGFVQDEMKLKYDISKNKFYITNKFNDIFFI